MNHHHIKNALYTQGDDYGGSIWQQKSNYNHMKMKNCSAIFFVRCILLAFLVGCDKDKEAEEDPFVYYGDPYTGSLNVVVSFPDNTSQTFRGTGSAHFSDEGDVTKLAVYGTIGEEGDASVSLNGSIYGNSWKGASNGLTLEINPDGVISGGGSIYPQKFAFGGTASKSEFNFVVELELLEESPEGLPVGTKFNYNYDLSRTVEGGTGNGRECNDIRWEFRNIWTPGGLTMIQVPVCY